MSASHPLRLATLPVARAAPAVATFALLTGCTGPDLADVPDVAQAPFACDGVPRAGVELLLGGEATVDRTRGAWGDDGTGFNCALGRGDAVVLVDVEGRDLTADVTRLLESMLPWACGGEDAPPATEE